MYTDENLLYLNENSGNVVFTCNGIGIHNYIMNYIDIIGSYSELY